VRRTVFASLALLSATAGLAQSSGFLLGVDYGEWLTIWPNVTQIETDNSGALYILTSFPPTGLFSPPPPPSFITKLSADGKTILWQNQFGFAAITMAVDPNGGVYVIPVSLPGDTSIFVAKLNASGSGIAWEAPAGFMVPTGWGPPLLAADSRGRTYAAGVNDVTNLEAEVVRLNAAGSALDYTAHVAGQPSSIAVDGSGSAFITGYGDFQDSFLARLAPDGSVGFYTSLQQLSFPPELALDANGNPVLFFAPSDGSGVLQRFDSNGAPTSTTNLPASTGAFPRLALDAAGNAYIGSSSWVSPVLNTLATCGHDFLNVIAPDGALLQRTYIPGGWGFGGGPLIATGPNSTVFVVDGAYTDFTPTQNGPFPAGQIGVPILLRFSRNANAQTFPLACMGNAATYDPRWPVAPGEIVTLSGNGLGPSQGIQTEATLQSPFPQQVAGVEVTFDGKPAPLLWVQDARINAVVPWSLTPGQTTQVCVSYNDVTTNCLTWPVAQIAPAVFTVDGTYAAALNQDGTINSADHPAPPGSIVAVFATGLGPIAPSQADGSLVGFPLPGNILLPVTVEAFWFSPGNPFQPPIPLVVTYAGPAPYLVAGVSQINFELLSYPNYPAGSISSISLSLPALGQYFTGLLSTGFQIYIATQ